MVTIHPGPVSGTVAAPPSKSVTHRAYLLAAQSSTPCVVRHPLRAADPDATLACLLALSAQAEPDGDAVRFTPTPLRPPAQALDCRNAGTALRLLAATCARLPAPVVLDGDASLRARPQGALAAALRQRGARVQTRDGRAPVRVHGPLRPGHVMLPAGISSQVASGLMLSLPMLPGPSTIHLAAPVASAPYLDITLRVAEAFQVPVASEGAAERTITTPGHATPRARHYDVDGDWSGAAFMLAAGAVAGDVRVTGLPGRGQGDRAIVEHLRSFGAHVEDRTAPPGDAPGHVRVRHAPLVAPGTIDVTDTPDLFPVLAAVAAHARGTTTFTGGHALRDKESDRIAAMHDALRRLGIRVQERPDGLVVHGGRVEGGTVTSRDDHRIHMALCLLALAATGPVTVDGDAAVSYPTFHGDLGSLMEGT